jgi:hypothetical protein
MALGTAPQRLIEFIETNWQATRAGRGDVPDTINYQTGGEDPRLNEGVLVLRDRENVHIDHGKHDLIHVYHPDATAPIITDRGYKEVNEVETVQIDIELTDRTDHTLAAGDQRLSAKDRMVGDRDDLASAEDPPYPGIAGETQYLLETIRRGLDEWDKVSHTYGQYYLGNSNADVSFDVELERIARNTVQ